MGAGHSGGQSSKGTAVVETVVGTGTAGYSDTQVNDPFGLMIGPALIGPHAPFGALCSWLALHLSTHIIVGA